MTDTDKGAAARAAAIRASSAEHVKRYVSTDGEDGFYTSHWPSLILTTTGRKSGAPRSAPLIFGEDAGRLVLVGSFGAQPTHPAWYLNLLADPRVHLQVRGERFAALARTATGAERERLWSLMVGVFPTYAEYATQTERKLPVVVLERA